MQMAGLILNQLLQFFLMMLLGFAAVKAGVLKPADSRVLSTVCIYLVMPCMIVNAFQIEYTPEAAQGLLLAFGAAVVLHLAFLAVIAVCGRIWNLNEIDKATVMYSNAGNLIVPLVTAVLGPEWVLYTSAYISVQMVLIWTHCKSLICGEKGFELKKILSNINILAILAGILLFALRVRLPQILTGTLTSMGTVIGPAAMLVMGMLLAGSDLKKVFGSLRLYGSALLRLVLCPAVALALIAASGAARLLPNADMVLFISFLACTAPASATITQMSQVYGRDAAYAGALNVVTTVLCLATMPVMAGLYWLVVG